MTPDNEHAAAAEETCSGCQQPLTRRGPGGECLRCLFDFALSPDPDAGSGDDDAAQASTSGALRYGHFEVAIGADGRPVELGAGAMAVTYRAHDTILDRDVALKVIDQRLADHPSARARFLREARAAAQLHHPNIATVTHYGEQDGECYYAMELIDGETLEQKVRREGPLTPELTLRIAIQVASALTAAEACGVVHRDLKPSNIMITSNGGAADDVHVKVIDCGLAKGMSAESSLGIDQTRGGFVGTPGFASPEQFERAEDTRVDTRSDIYSLGATLWYLLSGRLPFAGRSLEEIHRRQVDNPPPADQLATARVPKRLLNVLTSMLQADPAARPQSARELLQVLSACDPRSRGTSDARRRWLTISAAALLLVAALAWWSIQSGFWKLPNDKSVAVLPFENLNRENADAFFARGLHDSLTGELARVAELKVIGAESTRAFPPENRKLADIGRELGIAHVVEGSASREGDRIRVSASLVRTRTGARQWSKDYEGPAADIFAIQRDITREVAARLRAKLSPQETAALNEVPTTDPVAYDLYLRARAESRQFPNSRELLAGMNRKLALLEQAVQRDPNFVLAHLMIAECHDEIHGDSAAKTPEEKAVDHRALAEVALQKARRLRPNDGRVHLAQAYHFLRVVRDDEQARIEIDLARQTLPNSAELEQVGAIIAYRQARVDDALRMLEKAAALEPREAIIFTTLTWVYRSMRRYADFDLVADRLHELRPPEHRIYVRVDRTALAVEERGDLVPLREALATETPANESAAEYLNNWGLTLALHERDPDAILRALAATNSSTLHGRFPKPWFEAMGARMRGDEAGAQAAFARAREEVARRLEGNPSSAQTQSVLALIDAGLGKAEEAERGGVRACELADKRTSEMSKIYARYNLAIIYAWIGQADKALELLNMLVERPAAQDPLYQVTYGTLRLDPVWDPLRGDPRFAAVVDRLAPGKASSEIAETRR